MSFNVTNLFEQIQKAPQFTYSFNDDILKPKAGNTYTLRLLWLPPLNGSNRSKPMINQYVHHFWDDTVTSGSRDQVVYCPTSEYLDGNNGFKKCPICEVVGRLYEDGKTSPSAYELYKKFSRVFKGFIPVYVVGGPEEDVGKVKVLQYTKQIMEYLNKVIFGIKPVVRKNFQQDADVGAINTDEIYGAEAFSFEDETGIHFEAYNLILEVTSKQMVLGGKSVNMPQYAPSFSRKKTVITSFGDKEIVPGYFEELSRTLDFDRKYMCSSSEAELKEFKMKYITTSEVDDAADVEDEGDAVDIPVVKPAVKAAPAPMPKFSAPPAQEKTEAPSDLDIDSILDSI